jgi:hypothetical protein
MVFFHQHNQTSKGHTQHFGKCSRINSVLLGHEHSRLVLLNFLDSLDLSFIRGSLCIDFSFFLFFVDVIIFVILLLVVKLIINRAVRFLQVLTDLIVLFEFCVHLEFNEFADKRLLGLE